MDGGKDGVKSNNNNSDGGDVGRRVERSGSKGINTRLFQFYIFLFTFMLCGVGTR